MPLLAFLFLLAARGEATSGGPLRPEQAAYDVLHYELRLSVDPEARSIEGSLALRARVLAPLAELVLDLDDALEVRAVRVGERSIDFRHRDGVLRAALPEPLEPGSELKARVDYGGKPHVAERPPWSGGFTWAETAGGRPWIATSCQGEGADLWWPCKDHPSDEPESMDLFITVPAGLFVASNGRLEATLEHEGGTRTFHWHVSTPINNYGVALNIAPYEAVEVDYESVTGERFPFTYWVLPENLEAGRRIAPEFARHMRFFEETFGPYPFRADKYGVAETPHLGMEHQSIIAYGNQYRESPWGFDWLHHHELAHEWWANLVTAADWKDFWIHESFATYAQALYVEHLHGPDRFREYVAEWPAPANRRPLAPREPRDTRTMYFGGDGDSDNDLYYKGAQVLHTLRFLVGDEAFFASLRRMAYPSEELEAVTDGSQCRLVTTEDYVRTVERVSEQDLDWFFEVYVRGPDLPRLEERREGGALVLAWEAPGELPFPMPVEVRVGDETRRVEIPAGGARLEVGRAEVVVDPRGWILRAP